MEHSISVRIGELIKQLGLTQNAFAKELKTSSSRISNITTGRNKPDSEILSMIIQKFRNVSAYWLLIGEGEMLVDNARNHARIDARKEPNGQNEKYIFGQKETIKPETSSKAEKGIESYIKGDFVRPIVIAVDQHQQNNIFLIDAKASAGLPANFDNPQYFQDMPKFYLPGNEYQNGSFILIQACGDSMQPTILQGDYLLARFVEDWYSIKDNTVCVAVTDSGVVVKRIINRLKERKTIVMQSDNQSIYSTYEQPVYNIHQVYEVKARLTFNLNNVQIDLRQELEFLKSDVIDLRAEVQQLKGK